MSQQQQQQQQQQEENDGVTVASRRLPLISDIIYFPVVLFTAFLHLTTKPLGLEPAFSMLYCGCVFGMALIPLTMVALVLLFLDLFVYPGIAFKAVYFVGGPFAILYTVQILILDRLHRQAKNANPHVPRNRLEEYAEEFLLAGHSYFPSLECVPWSETATLDPSEQYVFGVHPHGIHCLPLLQLSQRGSVFDKRFPNLVGRRLTGLGATVIFKIPVVREFFIRWGYIDASRTVASRALEEGRSLYIVTGGEEESVLTETGQDIVVLKSRKGFVRLALSHGATLVPVFGVGNTDLYQTYRVLEKQRRWIQKTFGVALPIFHGRFLTPMPYKMPVKVLIGKPIPTPTPKIKGARPDEELVNEYHAKYIDALMVLHARNVKDRTLQIH